MDKETKCLEIDTKTRYLISQGAPYPPENQTVVFSLSDKAQSNWRSLFSTQGWVECPYKVQTNDNGIYVFADSTEIANCCLYIFDLIHHYVITGSELKLKVNEATTQEELDLVVDNRVVFNAQ